MTVRASRVFAGSDRKEGVHVRKRACCQGAPLKLSENPVVRMLTVIVVVAAGIRVIYELLLPVAPYLLACLVVFTVIRVARWYRGRW